MRLVDEIKIRLCAGKGGDGIVSWLRLKFMPKGGPAGGDGGKGGDVYIEAVKDIEVLRKYAGVKFLKAKDGKPGQKRSKKGEDGEDLTVYVPVGAHVRFDDKELDFTEPGQRVKVLRGGKGGLGNVHFKSSRNTTPTKATKGKEGECADFIIELHTIADVGLIGKPNAGKSSLLNALSNSKAKVGNFPFTTVEPNLAVFDGLVLADIPGLIEGASSGKGLGIKFLKHIKRTKALLHLVSSEEQDPCAAYKMIRKELGSYDKSLLEKKELVILSKVDLLDEKELKDKIANLEGCTKTKVLPLSLNSSKLVDKLKEEIKKLFN